MVSFSFPVKSLFCSKFVMTPPSALLRGSNSDGIFLTFSKRLITITSTDSFSATPNFTEILIPTPPCKKKKTNNLIKILSI